MHKSSGKGQKIIDRVISKFKMAKRGSQRTANVSQVRIPEKNNSSNEKLEDPESHETPDRAEINNENQRVSLQDLPAFCDQLEKFIKYIQNVRDLKFLVHDYPVVVGNRFDNDVHELESMLSEINSALTNISKQKLQHNYVKKEKVAIKNTLNKLREDEYREMEKVIALYDKGLYTRWENAKMTHKPEVLRTLLTDVKCKQLALENLDTLVTRKLRHLKTYSSIIINRNEKNDTEKTVIPLPLVPICPVINENSNNRKSRIPLPPPLPPPPNFAARREAQNFSVQRQGGSRRLETAEDYDNQYRLLQDIEDLFEIQSLTSDNVPNNFIISLDGNYRPEIFSSSQFSDDNINLTDELLAASLQEEMSTVLQVSDDFSHSV